MSDFSLHPRLAAGTHPLGRLAGCRILLKDNAHFPWLLIVPEVSADVEDLHQLDAGRYAEITTLIRSVSIWMEAHFRPTKLNVACIGNQVRQMHLHLVARSEDDAAWPGTVWAFPGKKSYEDDQAQAILAAFRTAFPDA